MTKGHEIVHCGNHACICQPTKGLHSWSCPVTPKGATMEDGRWDNRGTLSLLQSRPGPLDTQPQQRPTHQRLFVGRYMK